MPRPTSFPVFAASIVASCVLLLGPPAAAQQVVANQASQTTKIDLHTLRAIFGMRLTEWPNGIRITVYVMHPDAPLHTEFTKRKLHLFPYQLTQAWDRLVFSGTGQAPIEVSSPAEMRRRVQNTPGAIGYLPAKMNPDGLIQVEIKE
jgi:ABC-type phosphate transport system substrate-binding protein